MHVRVYNYNTMERVHKFEAHSDYLRCLAAHPTQPYLISSSDDMSIKLWDWDKKWQNIQTFEGHGHYVMQIVVNPKDNNQFASASLDKTVKVRRMGMRKQNIFRKFIVFMERASIFHQSISDFSVGLAIWS